MSDGKNSAARLRYQEELQHFYESLKSCRDEKVHGLLKEVEQGILDAFQRKSSVDSSSSECEVKLFALSLEAPQDGELVH